MRVAANVMLCTDQAVDKTIELGSFLWTSGGVSEESYTLICPVLPRVPLAPSLTHL